MNKPVTSSFMAMKGAGYYSKATVGAKHVMDNAAQMVIDAVDRMQLKDDGSIFRATDMGCADGGTSTGLWGRVLGDVSTIRISLQSVFRCSPRTVSSN